MERLNSIAPVLQYQQEQNANGWTLPCEPESIPALQNWLEQLSASIQTDDNIYPEILTTTPQQQPMKPLDISAPPQLLSADDYDLYPKLDDNNVWTSPVTSNTSHTPNQQHTSASESSVIHTPPYYEEEEEVVDSNKPPPLPPRNIKAQFWSPGYIYSPTHIDRPSSYIRKDEYTPSDAINFTSVPKLRNPPAPTIVFQTAVEKSKPPTPVIDPTSTVSFDSKKELMHMMNVFSSSKGKQAYKPAKKAQSASASSSSSSPLTQSSTVSTSSSIEASPTIKKQQVTIHTKAATTVVDYNNNNDKEEPEVESPYADLVGLIRNMKVEDEVTLRKRHALLVDQLWNAVARLA